MRSTLCAALVCLTAHPASAMSITAVCRDIGGIRFDEVDGAIKADRDGLKDVSWSYSGDEATGKGTLILQSSKAAGGKARTEKAYLQRMKSDHWSFVSVLDDAVWVHSIYPATGRLLVTQSTSTFINTLSSKMMTGTCQVSTR